MMQPQLNIEENAGSSEVTVAFSESFIMMVTEVQEEKHPLSLTGFVDLSAMSVNPHTPVGSCSA